MQRAQIFARRDAGLRLWSGRDGRGGCSQQGGL